MSDWVIEEESGTDAGASGRDRGRAHGAGRRVVAAAALHGCRLDPDRAGRPAADGRRDRGRALADATTLDLLRSTCLTTPGTF